MPKIIDHEKRKQDILKRAFVIFSQRGFQDTNLSYIAERCGISRPTLYLYFKDKEEIFHYAVKEMTSSMFHEYKTLFSNENKSSYETLCIICDDIIHKCYRRKEFFSCLVDFIFQMKRQERDFSKVIERRTIALIYLFSKLIAKGVQNKEFKELEAKESAYELFSLLEAFAFQIALLDKFDPDKAIKVTRTYLNGLKLSS